MTTADYVNLVAWLLVVVLVGARLWSVRALLCDACNTMLGLARDDAALLRGARASTYRAPLERMGCWPPTCYVCDRLIGEDEEVTFRGVRTKTDDGQPLMAIVHAACRDRPPKEPTPEILAAQAEARAATAPRPSGGAYVPFDPHHCAFCMDQAVVLRDAGEVRL